MPEQPLGKWKGYNLSGNKAADIQFKKHTSCSLLQCNTKQHTQKTWKGLRVTWRIMSDEVALSFCMNTGSILTYLAGISHYLERMLGRISVGLSPQTAWPLYVSAQIPTSSCDGDDNALSHHPKASVSQLSFSGIAYRTLQGRVSKTSDDKACAVCL